MHGSGFTRLLAIPFLILSPVLLCGQSDRKDLAAQLASELARTLPPLALPPDRDPTAGLRRRIPIAPGSIGFPQLARAAGTIFSGTVTAIARRPPTRGQSVETVAITFHIENAIRGTTPGENLTISQWIGLWSSGQRYRVGERVLLFLYPASKLGLTSCVASPIGRFSIDPLGRVLLSAEHLSAFRTDPVLGGKSRVTFGDFAWAVRRASEEQ